MNGSTQPYLDDEEKVEGIIIELGLTRTGGDVRA
jgi:hypothetical protein